MAKRKIDGARLALEEQKVAMLLGALEQVRRDLEEAHGGCVARALETCARHLGESSRKPRTACS